MNVQDKMINLFHKIASEVDMNPSVISVSNSLFNEMEEAYEGTSGGTVRMSFIRDGETLEVCLIKNANVKDGTVELHVKGGIKTIEL